MDVNNSQNQPPAANSEHQIACRYCGDTLVTKKANQAFCGEPHRRAYEKLIRAVGTAIHPGIRLMIDEVIQAHQEPAITIKPWGSFEVLVDRPGMKIKRLAINEGHRFSLQLHRDRDEFWFDIQGAGFIEIVTPGTMPGDEAIRRPMSKQVVHVPRGTLHRITGPLVLMEVQLGNTNENHIERLEDDYGR